MRPIERVFVIGWLVGTVTPLYFFDMRVKPLPLITPHHDVIEGISISVELDGVGYGGEERKVASQPLYKPVPETWIDREYGEYTLWVDTSYKPALPPVEQYPPPPNYWEFDDTKWKAWLEFSKDPEGYTGPYHFRHLLPQYNTPYVKFF